MTASATVLGNTKVIIGRPPFNGRLVAELQDDDGRPIADIDLTSAPFETLAELALAFLQGKSILFLRCGSRTNAETRVWRINAPLKAVLGRPLVVSAGGGTYHLTGCRVKVLPTITLYAPHHLPERLVLEPLRYATP
jgi:hypothetical protein